MSGALAWQVNNSVIKSLLFGFWGRSHGFPGSAPGVRLVFLWFMCFRFYLRSCLRNHSHSQHPAIPTQSGTNNSNQLELADTTSYKFKINPFLVGGATRGATFVIGGKVTYSLRTKIDTIKQLL